MSPKQSYDGPGLELKCINTIRALSADQPEAAVSGHPGAPMGCAPMAHLLWNEVMNYSPSNPKWINRDRFVLSNGHACALQYSMLHLSGYPLSIADLKQFRRLDSKTPGHPESFVTEGVEVCTGPLGQGICNAVGMAMAEKHYAAEFNTPGMTIFDNYTYVICAMDAFKKVSHRKLLPSLDIWDSESLLSCTMTTTLPLTEVPSLALRRMLPNDTIPTDGTSLPSPTLPVESRPSARQLQKPRLSPTSLP